MFVEITVECETIQELLSHLGCLIDQVKEKRAKECLTFSDEFTNGNGLADDNCYGTHHTCIIEGSD